MFHEMIKRKRDAWISMPDCPVRETIQYMLERSKSGAGLREIQVDAIKTYLFLKIACGNRSLAKLFSDGAFSSLDLNAVPLSSTTRTYLATHPASAALLEFALQKEEGAKDVLAPDLAKVLKESPEKINAEDVFDQIFYHVSYPDYLFSLPMGAGKTYLMAAFMYLDLMYAQQEPENPAFAHNFIVLAPSGTKSSIVPSLRTIEAFNPAWVIPEPLASNLKQLIKFEILDSATTSSKSNQVRNPNVQKIARFQPYQEMFGVVLVTNAEKVILDRVALDESGMLLHLTDDEKAERANELRVTIGKIPSLAILIDEAHHTASQTDKSNEVKLRAVVNSWAASEVGINSVLGFSGTPYLDKAEKVELGSSLAFKTEEIANTVYYYPLVRGVGDFLKKPTVTVVGGAAQPLSIVRRGVKEFFEKFGRTKYANGCFAKLAIYCGGVDRLEEEVYPEVAKIVKNCGLDPAAVILKYHRGNAKYKEPEGAQLEFEQLDFAFSKKRVVLLVQIGKEGWDCRSLAGVILSQDGDCPRKMVLQTSCRCMREVENAEEESASIYLNASNGKHLEDQLAQQQHTTLQAFQSGVTDGILIKRYDRTAKLALPTLPFYQLKVGYGDDVIVDKVPVAERLKALKRKLKDFRTTETVTTGDFKDTKKDIYTTHGSYADRSFAMSYSAWLSEISKESFGVLKLAELKTEDKILGEIFKVISVKDSDGDSVLSATYRQDEIRSAIRRAYWPSRKLSVKEEEIPIDAKLLDVQYLNEHREELVADEKSYLPSQKECAQIIRDDEKGISTGETNPNVEKWRQRLEEAIAEEDEDAAALYREKIARAESGANAKDYSYHYLPYKTDSGFERDFFKRAIATAELKSKHLEVYYNGDAPFTEFRIRCYRKIGGIQQSVGQYTPDFLIIQRDKARKKIVKCLIVETKGELYANDPAFKSRKAFMQTTFLAQNKGGNGFPEYDYLYLQEDKGGQWQGLLVDEINKFFKE